MSDASQQRLEDLNRRLRPALAAFFKRRVADHAEAEDLTQEVFIRLARSDGSHIEQADHYVFRIAANLLYDRTRRLKVRAEFSAATRQKDHAGVDALDPFRVAAGHEDLALLARIMTELPDKTRRIFMLYRIENIDKREIAASFGLSVRMVEVHIQRALAMVHERMGEQP